MKKHFLFLALLLCGLTFSAEAQTRFIINNSPCNHVVVVEWVDMACNYMGMTQHASNPGSMLMIIGPGGPFSAMFQMNHVVVDNTATGLSTVGNPACAGVPPVATPGGFCAGMIQLNPGADVTIN